MPSLLDFTYNTRDIGGFRTAGGALTKHSAYWRSDLPHEITDCDVAAMLSMGMTDIIDLRSAEELHRQPCALAAIAQLRYRHCPLAGDGLTPDSPEQVADGYLAIAGDHAGMAAVMRAVASAKGGVLCHGTAGKDRTGVVTAILMMLAGVSDGDIISDYLQSRDNLRVVIDVLCRDDSSLNKEIMTPQRPYIEEFLTLFRQSYGDARQYLCTVGLDDAEINAIVDKLI